ncbi:MAG: hypothetical protein ACTSRP_25610 [Candidatus Helarchaeota archaeon]
MFSKIQDYIKNKYHILLPILSLSFWLLYALIHENFFISILDTLKYDFLPLYNAGKVIFSDPSSLYKTEGYYYLPSFAYVYGILFSWQPTYIVWYVHLAFSFFLGILSIFEYDRILVYLNLEKKTHRAFLNTLSFTGALIYGIFYMNQAKLIVVLTFLFILRRELEFRLKNKNKNIKFYIINFSLLIFALSIMPYLIFFAIIYILNDIDINELFKISSIKIYFLFVIIFIIQNFIFLIYPNLIFDFLFKGMQFQTSRNFLLILKEWPLTESTMIIIKYICLILLTIFTFLLYIFKNNLFLEEKFGYLSIIYLFVNPWKGYSSLILLIPLILITLIPYIKKINIKEIYKDLNLFLVIIAILYLELSVTYNQTFFKYLPFTKNPPYIYLLYLRWTIGVLFFGIFYCLLKLKRKRDD